MMNFTDLKSMVIEWGDKRGITGPDNSRNQLLKFHEESGELDRAELKNDRDAMVDAIGDVMVTLIIYSKSRGLEIEECLESAYNEIKNRTGGTVNGVFIKD